MAQAQDQDLVDRFESFLRRYYSDEVGELARNYPRDQKSLRIDWDDLYQFDADLADDYLRYPDRYQESAEQALLNYDLPIDVSLGQAHVRVRGISQSTDIRALRSEHLNQFVAVQGIVRKATEVRPKIEEAVFVCQRCNYETLIPQSDSGFQEPYQCESCERQGPFKLDPEKSEFVDAQKLRIQENPEGLAGGETPENVDVHVEDDMTGRVTPGDHVTATGTLRLDQSEGSKESPIFDVYMEGNYVEIEDEQFEDMEITNEDKEAIVEISQRPNIYEQMVDSIAPSIYGHRQAKLAMLLQLFSGVTKHLPDGSRIRGDLHMLLIGDPGTGKCLDGDTLVTLSDGTERPIRELVEENLDDPTPVDDGVWDEVDIPLPSMEADGSLTERRATKVWKREAPEDMYRVRTSSGRELDVTPSHPLFVRRDGRYEAVRAEHLEEGECISTAPKTATDGGVTSATTDTAIPNRAIPEPIDSIERVEPAEEWVYDLEVEGTHTYLSNGVVSHNSQLLSYIQNIAPRSVYTSGKGSSSAGLTAAAVRDDFGDGQQWTLEAGALVLADQGIAAVDELDKMRCVTGETLVSLGDGSVKRMRDVARDAERDGSVETLSNGRTIRGFEDLSVLSMTDAGRIVERPVTAVHEYDAPDDLTEVTLESGERVTSTADHPYFVFEGGDRVERGAAELEAGDWVYVPDASAPMASDGGVVTADRPSQGSATDGRVGGPFAAVLGYLSGDGNVYYDRENGSYGVRFTNTEGELLADFEDAASKSFDAEPVRHPSEQRADGVETVHVHGKAVADAVLDAGMNLETYDRKAFPTAVSEGGRATRAAFVRALADSEGSVDTTTGNVKIHSSSRELLGGTRELLRGLGVSAQIQTREREEKRTLFVLAITSAESLANYRRYVGFTLDRKQAALDEVCERVDGSRTILDVIPNIGAELAETRAALRLHQDECGTTAYGDFERGDANTSIHRASAILEAFEARRDGAERDLERLADEVSWGRLEGVRERYHVSQAELADGLEYSQQSLSRHWGEDEGVRTAVRDRLASILADVRETDVEWLASLVHGDVKWRRVASVETTSSESVTDDRTSVLEAALADELECPAAEARDIAVDLLDRDPRFDDWAAVAAELERYGVPQRVVADAVGVEQSTLSRWLRGVVDSERFDAVAAAAKRAVEEKRERLAGLVDEIDDRRAPRVYDLTVDGTHNFVANGMVVHNSEDRSAMHQALEQQSISVSKAGINATLKSRCSLLGAANPKYGRFDQYEPIGEQIDLEPALISRFDLIFTVADQPDPEEDAKLAQHILQTNYAGELHTQREHLASANYTEDEVAAQTNEVAPEIDAGLLRKYIAYSRRNVYPTMSEEARAAIEEFYVDLRAEGADEDAPVPVTARKLEALVRLAEASARVRLSDTVEESDAERVIAIVRSCLEAIGVDPETGEFDADVVETGTSKSQRDRIKNLKALIEDVEADFEDGAPVEEVMARAEEAGTDRAKAEHEIEKLKKQGEVYEPSNGHLRTT